MIEHTHSWRTAPGSSYLRKVQRCDECGERRKLLYTGRGYAPTQTLEARQQPIYVLDRIYLRLQRSYFWRRVRRFWWRTYILRFGVYTLLFFAYGLFVLATIWGVGAGEDMYHRGHVLHWTGETRVSPSSTLEYACECPAGDAWWLDKADCSG